MQYFFSRLHHNEDYGLPYPLAKKGLLLAVPAEQWNRVFLGYHSPALTLACQLMAR